MLRYKIIAVVALFVAPVAAQQKVMPCHGHGKLTEFCIRRHRRISRKNSPSDYIIHGRAHNPSSSTGSLIRSGQTGRHRHSRPDQGHVRRGYPSLVDSRQRATHHRQKLDSLGDKAKTLGHDDDLGVSHSNTMVSQHGGLACLSSRPCNTGCPNTVRRCASRG